MNVVALTETVPGERRVAVTPQSAAKLVALGAEVAVESGLGTSIFRADTEYAAAGVKVGARADLDAGGGVLGVGPEDRRAEAGLHRHLRTQGDELGGALRGDRHAPLAGDRLGKRDYIHQAA